MKLYGMGGKRTVNYSTAIRNEGEKKIADITMVIDVIPVVVVDGGDVVVSSIVINKLRERDRESRM